jgi:hypothetical protein
VDEKLLINPLKEMRKNLMML